MKKVIALLVLSNFIIGCSDDASNAPLNQATQTKQSPETASFVTMTSDEALKIANKIFADYFEENKAFNPIAATFLGDSAYNDKFNPIINTENLSERLAFEKQYLQQIKAINPELLTGQERLSYEIFKRDREIAIEGAAFPSHLIPINQMYGMHNFYAQLGSGQSAQPFNTLEDFDNFIKRSKGFALWMDSTITAMAEGLEKGIVQPDVVMNKVIPQLAFHLVDKVDDSVFATPLKNMSDSITADEKTMLETRYKAMITETILPAYKRLHDFIVTDYLPKSRQSVGISEHPNGKAWYQYQIKINTTLDLTADEIHLIGKNEVARILGEMDKVKQTVGFEGSLAEFFEHLKSDDKYYFNSEQELIAGYESTRDKINKLTPKLFSIFPKADYEVKLVEPFRASNSR
ncbi:MAG: hypothetical protein COA74_02660 [Gammaproteobacteria bacterium]|nr:MAG: hypothetical protein COA74_02660 [Gammaproteobacteria bacterium]